MAEETAALSEKSTENASVMQLMAMSMLSESSSRRVPSLREEDRKSQTARARRCLEFWAACGGIVRFPYIHI